jgi:nucleoid-associated protein YgaU
VADHPAIHPDRGGKVVELFPRAGRDREAVSRDKTCSRDARAESMRRHPAGKGLGQSDGETRITRRHIVRAGDTLWSIAAKELRTEELPRIARYWPRIHRLNRAVIGPDPSKIFAGQVLYLPEEISK